MKVLESIRAHWRRPFILVIWFFLSFGIIYYLPIGGYKPLYQIEAFGYVAVALWFLMGRKVKVDDAKVAADGITRDELEKAFSFRVTPPPMPSSSPPKDSVPIIPPQEQTMTTPAPSTNSPTVTTTPNPSITDNSGDDDKNGGTDSNNTIPHSMIILMPDGKSYDLDYDIPFKEIASRGRLTLAADKEPVRKEITR